MNPLLATLVALLFLSAGCAGLEKNGHRAGAQNPVPPEQFTSSPIPTQAPASAEKLLNISANLKVVELPSAAIPIWRTCRDQRPTLALFSADPFLDPIPEQLRTAVSALVERGENSDFQTRAKVRLADPLLLPQQAVSAAVQGGFFSKILWVFPLPDEGNDVSLDVFRQQLIDGGLLEKDEADKLSLENGVFYGTLRGLPFQAATMRSLPSLDGPVVVHLDLSYFSALYRNEVTTPLYTLAHQTLEPLRKAAWPTPLATLSVSTEEGAVPMELRFLKDVLTETFAHPELLDAPLPESWTLRKDARYYETFYQGEIVLSSYLAMEKLAPQDASVKYDLYRVEMGTKEVETALGYLAEAVSLELGYGQEYVSLGLQFLERGRTEEGINLLQRAAGLFPDNPFIRLALAENYLILGKRQPALEIIQKLRELPWSPVYYPEMPELLLSLGKGESNSSSGNATNSSK